MEIIDSVVPAASVRINILDTCVLLHNPNSIFDFKDSNVVIPTAVIDEIDEKKSRPDDVGRQARNVSRILDGLLQRGSLKDGVILDNGGILSVVETDDIIILNGHVPKRSHVDEVLIQLAKNYSPNATVVTRDTNLRIKCSAAGINCVNYSTDKPIAVSSELYGGVTKIEVDDSTVEDVYAGNFSVSDLKAYVGAELYPNHIFVLKSGSRKSVIVRYDHDQQKIVKVRDEKEPDAWKIKPRNKEQNFALDLLLNRNIQLVTLVGSAGTGKTLLAIAAGLSQVIGAAGEKNPPYKSLIVTRPIQPLGNDLGYLPGTMEEKMGPWIAPIMDNLKTIVSSDRRDDSMLQLWFERGQIEIEAITYIRGRSIPHAFMIIDEAQNLTAHELKTIITRAGEGTKIVMTGDIEQIDNKSVDATNNGLTYAIEKFKDQSIAGHVTLIKGERSKLASLAAKIL